MSLRSCKDLSQSLSKEKGENETKIKLLSKEVNIPF